MYSPNRESSVAFVSVSMFLVFLVCVGAISVAFLMILKNQVAEMDHLNPPKNAKEEVARPCGLEAEELVQRVITIDAERRRDALANPIPIRLEIANETIYLADTGRLISDEELKKMEIADFQTEVDAAYAAAKAKEKGEVGYVPPTNSRQEFTTAAGKFEIVSCFGRFSSNAEASNYGGMRFDVLVTPTGNKYRMFPAGPWFSNICDIDGRTYLVSSGQILEWLPDTARPEADRVVSRITSGDGPTYISGVVGNRFIRVNHSSESRFGGLLVPDWENTFRFIECPIKGTMVRDAKIQQDGRVLLSAWDGDPLVFDPCTEEFKKFAAIEK